MRVARKAQAAQFGANVLPIIRDIQAAGHTSLNAIAGQLNARKVATANGGQWRHAQVRQILDRASAVTMSNTSRRAFELKVASSGRMDDFVSEDDLDTFEGWLRYQAIDLAQLLPAEAAVVDVCC